MRFAHRDSSFMRDYRRRNDEREARGHAVEVRGQDIQKDVAMRGHDIAEKGWGIKKENWAADRDMQREQFGQKVQNWAADRDMQREQFEKTFGLTEDQFTHQKRQDDWQQTRDVWGMISGGAQGALGRGSGGIADALAGWDGKGDTGIKFQGKDIASMWNKMLDAGTEPEEALQSALTFAQGLSQWQAMQGGGRGDVYGSMARNLKDLHEFGLLPDRLTGGGEDSPSSWERIMSGLEQRSQEAQNQSQEDWEKNYLRGQGHVFGRDSKGRTYSERMAARPGSGDFMERTPLQRAGGAIAGGLHPLGLWQKYLGIGKDKTNWAEDFTKYLTTPTRERRR